MDAREEAERLWNAVEIAAKVLPDGSSIDLGSLLPEGVVRALAAVARERVIETLHLEHEEPARVCVRISAQLGRVYVSGAHWRPATPGDIALRAYRGGPGDFVTPEEAAKALGVSHG